MQDADGIPGEMYTLLEDVEAETAADVQLRTFLGQQAASHPPAQDAAACRAADGCAPEQLTQIGERR